MIYGVAFNIYGMDLKIYVLDFNIYGVDFIIYGPSADIPCTLEAEISVSFCSNEHINKNTTKRLKKAIYDLPT